MKPSKIIDKAIRLTYTNNWEYNPETEWLEDLIEVLQDVYTTIDTEVNEEYLYDIYTTDLVEWQNEYTFQTPTSTSAWMNKFKYLYIKYWNEYKRARYVSEATMQETPFYNEVNRSEADPIWYIADESVFIYPAPKSNVTDWLKASVSIMPQDILYTDEEDAIRIPRQYHKVLVEWLMWYIYQQRWLLNEANNQKNIYEQSKNDLVRKMSDRDTSPLVTWLPDLSYYE